MKSFAVLMAIVLPLGFVPAHASLELATKSHCMSCHGVDQKKLGPAFKDISAKYTMGLGCAKDDGTAMLADSILKGSRDKWGKIPMPPQKIAPVDAQKLTRWILTL